MHCPGLEWRRQPLELGNTMDYEELLQHEREARRLALEHRGDPLLRAALAIDLAVRRAVRAILDLCRERGADRDSPPSIDQGAGTAVRLPGTICGSYENTSRLRGSTVTLIQFTSLFPFAWLSPKVS